MIPSHRNTAVNTELSNDPKSKLIVTVSFVEM
jgi:hypothetical protein